MELGSGELPTEEAAGIGTGLGCLTVISLAAAGFVRRPMTPAKTGLARGIFICGLVAFGVYLIKMGTESGPRLLSSYYPLLIMGAFAVRGGESLPRFRLWRLGAILAALSAFPAVMLTPSRPLIPVKTALTVAPHMGLPAASLERMGRVYDVYQQRADVLAPIREALPSDTRTVGWLGGGDIPQIALWRPFGSRQVVEILPGADGKLPPVSPRIIVASPSFLEFLGINNPQEWQKANGLKLLHEIILVPKASRNPEKFWVLQRL